MGTHSRPIDGTVTANGHQLVPLVMTPLQQRGDMSVLPQQDSPGQSRTEPDGPRRRALAMSAFRRNWWRLVFAVVGAVAAIVSYGHIVNLFLTWHAPLYDARLMPIAIDGLIIIGAGAAKGGQKWLGWSAIGPGLAASLYANVMNGLPYGRGAAMGSGWATIALFLATNVMERWRAAPVVTPRHDGPGDTSGEAAADAAGDQPGDTVGDRGDDDGNDVRPPPRRRMSKGDKVLRVMTRHPGLPDTEVAKRAGVSLSTVQRAKRGSKP